MVALRQLAGRSKRGVEPPPQRQPDTSGPTTTPGSAPPPQGGRVPESVLVRGNQAYGTGGELAAPPLPPEAPPPPYPGWGNDGLMKVKSTHEYDYIQNNRTYTTAL